MMQLEDARSRVLREIVALAPRPHPLGLAGGLVIAGDIVSNESIPPFDNTAVDGFAVHAADVAGAGPDNPVELRLVGMLAAGEEWPSLLEPGTALQIMTGAPIPRGADAVVMVEDSVRAASGATVQLTARVSPGDAVRPAGDDVSPGELVIPAGTVLTPAHLGVLASLGVSEPVVHPRPRVGVISTGDELVEGPTPLKPGQIRDSNRTTLLGLVESAGAIAVDLGLIRDEEHLVRHAFEAAAASCDLVISSGGVSMGEFDMVKVVLSALGDMNWMQIAIKPAKPLAFGHVGATPIIGLPGNPVSSMVSFELFARPAIARMAGRTQLDLPRVQAVAVDGLARTPDGKTHFARTSVEYRDGAYELRSSGGQGSHQLLSMANANALAILPDGPGIEPGGIVTAILLRPMG